MCRNWKPIAAVAGSITLIALAACGSPDGPATIATPADTSMEIVLAEPSLEPAAGMSVAVVLVYDGVRHAVPSQAVAWTSSDQTIATIDAGWIVGRRPGVVTIGATVGGRSASRELHVQWYSGAKISIRLPAGTIVVGGRFQATAFVRGQEVVSTTQWSSSDTLVATVDSLGIVTPRAAGKVTIYADFAELTGSATFDVSPPELAQNFGYFYSYDAPHVDEYDSSVPWEIPTAEGYSTSVSPTVFLNPPYPTGMDLGWIGPRGPASQVLFHVVPFDLTPCAAYPNDRTEFIWTVLSAPQAECFDRNPVRSSYRMEVIAMDPYAFTGTMALVRPSMPPVMSNGMPIQTVDSARGMRDYQAPGYVRDSAYWFVSAGQSEPANCSVAPANATPASAMARVICRGSSGVPVDPVVNAIGIGAGARRGDNPHVFAELDALGRVVRTSTAASLTITATPAPAPEPLAIFDISITGARVAEFNRLPAVFLTPVSLSAPGCLMIAARQSASLVSVHVMCASAVDGLLIGVTY